MQFRLRPGGALSAITSVPASATDPLTIITSTTPWFYLVGDLGITIGTGISLWEDQSAANADASQGTGSAQPARNAAALNGHDTVLFDGGSDVLNFASLDLMAPGTQNIWFWAVFRQVTWTTNDSLYGGNSTTVTRLRQGGAGTPVLGATNGTTGPDNTGAIVNTWTRLEHLFKNTTGDYVKLASTTVTGTNTGNTNPAANAFCLGAHSTVAGGAGNTEWAAFGAWKAEPTSPEKSELDSWVTSFFGASVGV